MTVVRSKALYVGQTSAAGTTNIYTVPALHVCLVKHVRVVSEYNGSNNVQINVVDLSSNQLNLYTDTALAQWGALGGDTWFVLEAGFKLQVYSQHPPLDVIAAGAELSI